MTVLSRPAAGARASVPAWSAVAVTVTASLLALDLPGLRSPLITVAAWGSVALVVVGTLRHRPRPVLPWLLVAVMLALWAVGTTVTQVEHRISLPTTVLVSAGQAVAVAVTLVLVVRSRSPRAGRGGSGGFIDLLVIGTVLALVLVQVIAVATSSSTSRAGSSLVVPTIDVALAGLLLRVAVVHARLHPALQLGLAAAVATILYDLFAHVGGHRLALPADQDQVLGILCVLLFGAAALHPTMVDLFDPGTFVRRPPSAAFLGLLPLVVVPVALWTVSRTTGVEGLPTAVFLVTGSIVAGLCLVRGGTALRDTEHLAEHDTLTDLPNRRGLARAFAERRPTPGWSLLLVDIDEFKQVNDVHGHDVGDALLLLIRDRLLEATADRGVVARLGGDEFVVLTGPDDADTIAADLLETLRHPVDLGVLTLAVSASVGVAPPQPGASLSDLVTRADVAMYAAKAAGRDTTVTFRPQMRVDMAHRFTLTGEVRQLLGRTTPDVGQLVVHYQPLVELVSGVVVGAEALVRWQHPEHGLLNPGDFLELVNTSGLDSDLDAAVLRQVLDQLARWRAEGHPVVPVSVNLTRSSLLDPHLAQTILAGLDAAGLEPAVLDVEITEHEHLPDDGTVAEVLHVLKSAGIGVHLDDYGTGYTSLDYLRRFPISVLKLDRSVVCAVADGDDKLVAGLAAMAATLSVDLLAEGVETPEQHARLVELDIRYGQGLLYGRPVPAAVFALRHLAGAPVRSRDGRPVPAGP